VKRLVPFGIGVLAIILFSAAPASAQGTGGFQFGLSGGASFPTSDWSDAYGTGYNGGIVLNYELPALPLGIRVDGDYRNFSAQTSGGFSRSAEIFDGNANLVVGIRIVLVKVYALGGGGLYNMKFTAESAGVSSSISQTDFGWNAGAGVAFVVGKLSIFGEGRYHEVTLDNSAGKFKFVAATAGILF
jgi:Outer membrane protein beta-barrel domain